MDTRNQLNQYYRPQSKDFSQQFDLNPETYTQDTLNSNLNPNKLGFEASVIDQNQIEKNPLFASKITKLILIALVVSGIVLVIVGSSFLIMNTHFPLSATLVVGGGLDLSLVLLFVLISIRDQKTVAKIAEDLSEGKPNNDQQEFYMETQSSDHQKEVQMETLLRNQQKIKKQTSVIGLAFSPNKQFLKNNENELSHLNNATLILGENPSDHYTKMPNPPRPSVVTFFDNI